MLVHTNVFWCLKGSKERNSISSHLLNRQAVKSSNHLFSGSKCIVSSEEKSKVYLHAPIWVHTTYVNQNESTGTRHGPRTLSNFGCFILFIFLMWLPLKPCFLLVMGSDMIMFYLMLTRTFYKSPIGTKEKRVEHLDDKQRHSTENMDTVATDLLFVDSHNRFCG